MIMIDYMQLPMRWGWSQGVPLYITGILCMLVLLAVAEEFQAIAMTLLGVLLSPGSTPVRTPLTPRGILNCTLLACDMLSFCPE